MSSWRSIIARSCTCESPAVVGYTGVNDFESGVSLPTMRYFGCTISSPKNPGRTSPKRRTRLPGANCFAWLG